MRYNVIAVILSVIIPMLLIKEPIIKLIKRDSKGIKDYKYEFIAYIFIVIGCLIRSVCIDLYPIGLNVDEASSGYEAFSILNYGIDRNGNSFPVFLEAWGSGQNALYTYIMIPFIKLMGLNIISTRLPMVLISCISLVVWYKLLLKIKNKKFALIGLAFLVICPWHIMKSRWGLESNLFPDITLYSVFFIIKFLENKKNIYFYLGAIFLGLTAYSYGTAYFFLPLFFVGLLGLLWYKKEIEISKALVGLGIVGIISFSIILYLIINTFNLQELNLGPFTVPKLPINRYEEQVAFFSGNLLINLGNNFINSIRLLLTQNDGLIWNVLPGFGIMYIMTLPFVILGLICEIKEKGVCNYIFRIWFIVGFLLLFVLNYANINRINILIIPLIYYAVVGIYFCVIRSKTVCLGIFITYIVMFVGFEIAYFLRQDNGDVFVNDVKAVIEYVDKLENKDIYIEYAFKEPYIYVLYYTKYNTKEFVNTMEYFDTENLGRFDNIKGFGKYKFYLPKNLENIDDVVYVISKDNEEKIDYSKFEIKEFDKYIVLH